MMQADGMTLCAIKIIRENFRPNKLVHRHRRVAGRTPERLQLACLRIQGGFETRPYENATIPVM